MERYSEYKDSGVQWLGEIPGHWEEVRNKSLLKLTEEKVGSRTDITLLSLTKNGVIVRDLSEGKGKFPKDFGTYLVVRPNNLVFCLFDLDETPRTVGLVRNTGMLTGAYTNFEVNENLVLPEYIYYFYLQVDNIKGLRPYYTGLRKVVKTNTFLQIRIPLPPLPEQKAIAAYLDTKCGKIDQLLEGKQKQIGLLAEMKQRIIADAVTRGLNPSAKMKTTDIPWLPEIPAHWEVRRIKWLFKEEDKKNTSLSYQLLSFSRIKGIVPFDEINDKAPSTSDLSNYKVIFPGQLLENRMQAWSGMFACCPITGCVSPDYSVFSPYENVSTEFYGFLFRTPLYIRQFANASKGIGDGFNRLYTPQLFRIYAIFPPHSEQQKIVAYLNKKCGKIDTLTAKLEQEIATIKEYKQRLISDVVTGQIKVCG